MNGFFKSVNQAYDDVTSAKQRIETFVLGAEAEILSAPTFGLPIEEETVIEEETNGIQATNLQKE